MIPSDQTNIPTHFSSLYSALLCKQMEMYGQGKYIVTRKNKNKKEMYNLTLIVPLLYFLFLFQTPLSLSLSLSLILSAILGFPKLKIVVNLNNELHIGRIVY